MSRYERLKRRYQRTATTITSAGNRNPANADRGGSARRGRVDSFTTQACIDLAVVNATEPVWVGVAVDTAQGAQDVSDVVAGHVDLGDQGNRAQRRPPPAFAVAEQLSRLRHSPLPL
jgi:hypothetical protein